LAKTGSVAMQIYNNMLDAYFVESDGTIGDFFEIALTNYPGQVSLTAPANNSTFPVGSQITVSANATDPDTRIHRVMFFFNNVQIDRNRDFVAPYSYVWHANTKGTYTVQAESMDELGAVVWSTPITVTIN